MPHLLMDALYLAIIGTFAEYGLGWKATVSAFFTSVLMGGLMYVLFSAGRLVGSSAGTHGLLACVATYSIFSASSTRLRLLSLLTTVYLLYTSLYAIQHGVMAWPLTTLPNSGYDHLGGVLAGVVVGVVKVHLDNRRRQRQEKMEVAVV
jgi:membrane associated rhomboid family serine protease